jgi:DNA repair protein RadC
MTKILDLPAYLRPREKLLSQGADNLKDKELLAILLRTGRKGKSAVEIADEILKKHELKKILQAGVSDLKKIKGLGGDKTATILAAFELAKRALEVNDNNLPSINSAREAVNQLQELRTARKEHFVALYLNARNQLIHKETISIGTLNASLVHPREVFKPAIDHLGAGVIVAHNHPSGNLEASEEDRKMTARLKEAGEILGVELIDSLIITESGFASLKIEGSI